MAQTRDGAAEGRLDGGRERYQNSFVGNVLKVIKRMNIDRRVFQYDEDM